MTALDLAASLVRQFEGCKLTAYPDSGGILTIGFGHTGPEVHQGLSWTQAQADAALLADLAIAQEGVSGLVSSGLTDRQTAALISLAFNVGGTPLKGSHLIAAINNAQWIGAARLWTEWDHAGGKEVIGLLRRRMTEAALFLEGS